MTCMPEPVPPRLPNRRWRRPGEVPQSADGAGSTCRADTLIGPTELPPEHARPEYGARQCAEGERATVPERDIGQSVASAMKRISCRTHAPGDETRDGACTCQIGWCTAAHRPHNRGERYDRKEGNNDKTLPPLLSHEYHLPV